VKQNIGLFAVEEDFAGRRGDEHAAKHEGHRVQIDALRKYRLPEKDQRCTPDQDVENKRQEELSQDRGRGPIFM
jgi:hypothetical protein